MTYAIDKYSGKCSTTLIESDEFDSVFAGNHSVRLKTPKEFFDFGAPDLYPYQYMGQVLDRAHIMAVCSPNLGLMFQ